MAVLLLALTPASGAQDASAAALEQELAERYAPVMMMKAQEEPCDPDGEPYGPTSVDVVLDNPEVLLRQVGEGNPVMMRAPAASDLFGLGEGFFLDFPGSALQPGCIYETDFDRYREGLPAVVYAHIVQQEDHPDKLALQYWFYWYFNDWNNKHESDWEGIQLLFDVASVEEALTAEPVSVGYAQHEGGERATWGATKLERDGNRPFVYSSAGSHASYFGSSFYLGRSAGEGFGCDQTAGPSERLDPEVVVLPDRVEDQDDPLAWLAYRGRWGERLGGPFNGPTGVTAKERWLEPIDWHDQLRPSSVVIPGGNTSGAAVISTFCDLAEKGSGVLISLTISPARVVLTAVLTGLAAVWAVRRTSWDRVPAVPLRQRRRAGQIIRGALSAYRHSWKQLFLFGMVYVPTAVLVGLVGAVLSVVPVIRDVLSLAGEASGTNVAFALLAGSVANVAAYVAVNAMVAAYFETIDAGGRSAQEAARLVWERRSDLIRGFLRAFVIVGGLLVSIVGVPWGIRQLVRYQFLPQTVMLDDADAVGALARSSVLVRGRWWHTAVMVVVFNGLVSISGLVVGLLLLVLFSGLPLWLFSGLITLVSTLVAPLAAVGQTLLYGDAAAERDGDNETMTQPHGLPPRVEA